MRRVIDLTHTVERDTPGARVPGGFPTTELNELLSRHNGDPVCAELLRMPVHSGTHVDAPFHFFEDGERVDEIPVETFVGPAIVVDVAHKTGDVPIAAEEIMNWEHEHDERIRPGDAVLIRTGYGQLWATGAAGSAYVRDGWPHLSGDASIYLAEQEIRLLGVETLDPDHVDPDSPLESEFPTHRTLLSKGIVIVENLANLAAIPSTRCELIVLPLKLKGCSGAPARVIAIIEL